MPLASSYPSRLGLSTGCLSGFFPAVFSVGFPSGRHLIFGRRDANFYGALDRVRRTEDAARAQEVDEIGRQRRDEFQRRGGARMRQRKRERMQRLTREAAARRRRAMPPAVERIAEARMADRREMHADLMRPAGERRSEEG